MFDFRYAAAPSDVGQWVSLEQIVGTPGDTRVMLAKGGERVDAPPSLWPVASIAPFEGGNTTDMVLYKFQDVRVVGPGIVLRDDGALNPPGCVHPYVPQWIAEGWLAGRFQDFAEVTPDLPMLEMETAFVPLHFNMSVYGHFLLEIVPRLMVIRRLAEQGFRYPILLFGGGWPWIAQIMEIICPDNPIVRFDPRRQGVRLRNALLPPMGFHKTYLYHATMRESLQAFAAQAPVPEVAGPRLFIVRDKPTSFRFLSNHDALRDLCREFGFVAVAPEALTWPEQAGLFHQAEIVVGEFTSSLHNTVFCRPGTRVVAFNRMSGIQDAIGASFGHRTGYLMPPDGRVRQFERNWTERQDFEISVAELRERLESLCGTPKDRPA